MPFFHSHPGEKKLLSIFSFPTCDILKVSFNPSLLLEINLFSYLIKLSFPIKKEKESLQVVLPFAACSMQLYHPLTNIGDNFLPSNSVFIQVHGRQVLENNRMKDY